MTTTRRLPSISLHSLFALPEKKNVAIKLLSDVSTAYELLCKTKAPGRTGIKRKQEYDKLLAAFKTDKQDLAVALEPFNKLLNKHKDDGRLMDLLDDALWEIANGDKKLETNFIRRDELIPLLTKVDTLYKNECKSKSPGETGLIRKAKFDNILETLKNKERNFNLPFYQLCKMYKKKEGYSRLDAFIELALWKFFKLKLSPKREECQHYKCRLGGHASAHYAVQEYLADVAEKQDKLTTAINRALNPAEKTVVEQNLAKPSI